MDDAMEQLAAFLNDLMAKRFVRGGIDATLGKMYVVDDVMTNTGDWASRQARHSIFETVWNEYKDELAPFTNFGKKDAGDGQVAYMNFQGLARFLSIAAPRKGKWGSKLRMLYADIATLAVADAANPGSKRARADGAPNFDIDNSLVKFERQHDLAVDLLSKTTAMADANERNAKALIDARNAVSELQEICGQDWVSLLRDITSARTDATTMSEALVTTRNELGAVSEALVTTRNELGAMTVHADGVFGSLQKSRNELRKDEVTIANMVNMVGKVKEIEGEKQKTADKEKEVEVERQKASAAEATTAAVVCREKTIQAGNEQRAQEAITQSKSIQIAKDIAYEADVLKMRGDARVAEERAVKAIQMQNQAVVMPFEWLVFGNEPEEWEGTPMEDREQRRVDAIKKRELFGERTWERLLQEYKAKHPRAEDGSSVQLHERDCRPPESKWPPHMRSSVATDIEVGKFYDLSIREQWRVIDEYNTEEKAKQKKEEEDKIALAKLRADPLWPNKAELTDISKDEYNAVHGATREIVLEARERAKAYRQDNPEEWEKARQTPGPERLLELSLSMVYLSEPERNEIRARVPPQPECEPPTDPRLLEEWKGPTEDMLVTKDEWLARYALTESLRLEARKRVLALRDYLQYEFVTKHGSNIMCTRDCKCAYQENDPDLSKLRATRAIVAEEDATRWRTLDVDVYDIWGEYDPYGFDKNAKHYSDKKKAELKRDLAKTKVNRFWRHYDHLPPAGWSA